MIDIVEGKLKKLSFLVILGVLIYVFLQLTGLLDNNRDEVVSEDKKRSHATTLEVREEFADKPLSKDKPNTDDKKTELNQKILNLKNMPALQNGRAAEAIALKSYMLRKAYTDEDHLAFAKAMPDIVLGHPIDVNSDLYKGVLPELEKAEVNTHCGYRKRSLSRDIRTYCVDDIVLEKVDEQDKVFAHYFLTDELYNSGLFRIWYENLEASSGQKMKELLPVTGELYGLHDRGKCSKNFCFIEGRLDTEVINSITNYSPECLIRFVSTSLRKAKDKTVYEVKCV